MRFSFTAIACRRCGLVTTAHFECSATWCDKSYVLVCARVRRRCSAAHVPSACALELTCSLRWHCPLRSAATPELCCSRWSCRYPQASFRVLREVMTGRGPGAACTAAPRCALCWPAIDAVRSALPRMGDVDLLDWLLLYQAHDAGVTNTLAARLPRRRVAALYALAQAAYDALLRSTSFSPFPHTPPRSLLQHLGDSQGGESSRSGQPEGDPASVPAAWFSGCVAKPLRQLSNSPAWSLVCPETATEMRLRLEDADERMSPLQVQLTIAGESHLP